jgi:hypothetical protein
MPENAAPEQMEDVQARIEQSLKEFSESNPAIAEALSVMNMTMSEYVQAMDAIQGRQILPASTYVSLPVQANI